MIYKYYVKYFDGTETRGRITTKTEKGETYRDAWIKASRVFSELGEIESMIIYKKEVSR